MQENPKNPNVHICFLTEKEFYRQFPSDLQMRDEEENLTASNGCKVEICKNRIEGMIRVPAHTLNAGGAVFRFSLCNEELYIIEEQPVIENIWASVMKKKERCMSTDLCLLEILEALSKDDILSLQQLEKEMGLIEDALMKGRELSFSQKFLYYRRKLSVLHYYYEQMIDVGENLQAEYGRKEQEDLRLEWQQYSKRMERMHDYVNYLREYIIQLRDLYHTQMDDRQNRGINFLTVVTSLFLPLTLLTGWYGMNFAYMPEVAWKYGYIMIIAVAIIIIAAEVFYIRKKKIL